MYLIGEMVERANLPRADPEKCKGAFGESLMEGSRQRRRQHCLKWVKVKDRTPWASLVPVGSELT